MEVGVRGGGRYHDREIVGRKTKKKGKKKKIGRERM